MNRSFYVTERLWRRLRPTALLLTAQMHGERPIKLFTTTRVVVVWAGGTLEQWYGTLGGSQREDPQWLRATWHRIHTSQLDGAGAYRRLGLKAEARYNIESARHSRLTKGVSINV